MMPEAEIGESIVELRSATGQAPAGPHGSSDRMASTVTGRAAGIESSPRVGVAA